MTNKFAAISRKVSDYAGRPITFIAACVLILVWAACGPLFGFSDTWQLIVNTSTTIVTFLMVFLIQGATNRDSAAVQAKLDELIRASAEASDTLVAIEEDSEQHLVEVQEAARANKP
jgi:low affinity Fe/Cu permease